MTSVVVADADVVVAAVVDVALVAVALVVLSSPLAATEPVPGSTSTFGPQPNVTIAKSTARAIGIEGG